MFKMKLAIEGGQPVRTNPFPSWPIYGDEEKQALIRALEQGQWWRVSGSEVTSFEKEFADLHGASSALAVTNGTQALEVALLTLGIGPGDEVIVPAFTFISTSMAVQRVGAIAIPVDVDPQTYCIDVKAVECAITPKTKVVIPVHMAGHCAPMNELKTLLDSHNIAIIQDAAHAQGMEYDDHKVGQWDSIACFSFQNYKLMTAGEGGILTFPDDTLRETAFLVHNCGRPLGDRDYMHVKMGSNYRMNEFSAAVLREQLKRLQQQSKIREKNSRLLLRCLEDITGIIPQARLAKMEAHPHYMFMFMLDDELSTIIDRNFMVRALIEEGVPAFKNYRAIYQTEAFWLNPAPAGDADYFAKACPNTEKISNQGIWIHHSALLGNEQDTKDIAIAIKKVVDVLCDKKGIRNIVA